MRKWLFHAVWTFAAMLAARAKKWSYPRARAERTAPASAFDEFLKRANKFTESPNEKCLRTVKEVTRNFA